MASDISNNIASWSTTDASNQPDNTDVLGPNILAENLRAIQSAIKADAASSNTIASAATTDLSTLREGVVTVTGTTTITALGTVAAGVKKWLVFSGVLTLTHNGTSLILPTAANITTAAGDACCMLSLGSGNWKCLAYNRADGKQVSNNAVALSDVANMTANKTLTNANYALAWQWQLTGASSVGLAVSESAASTSGSGAQYLMNINTAAGSTAEPLVVQRDSVTALQVKKDGGVLIQGTSTNTASGDIDIKFAGQMNSGYGRVISIVGQSLTAGTSATAGPIYITAGSTTTSSGTSGFGGSVNIQGGAGYNRGGDVYINGGSTGAGYDAYARGNIYLTGGTNTGGDSLCGFICLGASSFTMKYYSGTGHLHFSSYAAPTIASGGGVGASIAGSDNAFQITTGTSPGNSITINFVRTWANKPIVVASHQGTQLALTCTATTTQLTIAAASSFSAGNVIDVICMGRE